MALSYFVVVGFKASFIEIKNVSVTDNEISIESMHFDGGTEVSPPFTLSNYVQIGARDSERIHFLLITFKPTVTAACCCHFSEAATAQGFPLVQGATAIRQRPTASFSAAQCLIKPLSEPVESEAKTWCPPRREEKKKQKTSSAAVLCSSLAAKMPPDL